MEANLFRAYIFNKVILWDWFNSAKWDQFLGPVHARPLSVLAAFRNEPRDCIAEKPSTRNLLTLINILIKFHTQMASLSGVFGMGRSFITMLHCLSTSNLSVNYSCKNHRCLASCCPSYSVISITLIWMIGINYLFLLNCTSVP